MSKFDPPPFPPASARVGAPAQATPRKADRLPALAPEPPKPGRLARLGRWVVVVLAALVIDNR